jgi:hypothetical protein
MIIDLITGSNTVVGNGNQFYDTDILYENQDVQTKIYIQDKLVALSQTQNPSITNENGGDGKIRRVSTKFTDNLSDGVLEYLVTREYWGSITDSEYYSVKKFVYTLTRL